MKIATEWRNKEGFASKSDVNMMHSFRIQQSKASQKQLIDNEKHTRQLQSLEHTNEAKYLMKSFLSKRLPVSHADIYIGIQILVFES